MGALCTAEYLPLWFASAHLLCGLRFEAGLLRNLFSFAMLNNSLPVVLQQEQGRRFTFSVCYCLHTDKNNSWFKYCLFLCIDVLCAPPMSVPLCLDFFVFTLCGPIRPQVWRC